MKIMGVIAAAILQQIQDYISSEQFKSLAKSTIKSFVERIVQLVMKEQNMPIK
ncbi:hypothetical protein LUY60_003001 [Listeria innocua]|nr:hypothetical protein [Listeria innocua]